MGVILKRNTIKAYDKNGNQTLADVLTGDISVNLAQFVLDKLYPVGSIYLETTNTNPSDKLGGTWEAYGSSDTYLRLGGNEDGGSNSIKLNANQIPSFTTGTESAGHTHGFSHTHGTNSTGEHIHLFRGYRNVLQGSAGGSTTIGVASRTWISGDPEDDRGSKTGNHTHTTNSQSTSTTGGVSNNHNHSYTNDNQQDIAIEPKYVGVYAWKRIA